MYVTSYPLVDALSLIKTGELNLRLFKRDAFDYGFVWIMLLLARERDARESYLDIKHYWNSYDDLTGDIILFLFSSGRQIYSCDEDSCFLHNIALRNQTSSVSDLCDELGIGEDKIPSIVLLPTDTSKQYSLVISIENDDLYSTIKSLMDSISLSVRAYRAKRTEVLNLETQRRIIRQQIGDYCLSSSEKRFLKASDYISEYMSTMESDSERNALADGIKRQSIQNSHCYPRLLRRYINQYIDLVRTNQSFADCPDKLVNKQKQYNKLSDEIRRLGDSIAFARHSLNDARHMLEDSVIAYCETKQKRAYLRLDYNTSVHFKISFSFSGKYLEKIRLICECLLRLGYTKDEIFFYPWHEDIVNGVDSDKILMDLYSNRSDCIVVLLSEDYTRKNWTKGVEWGAIKELIYSGKGKNICLLKTGCLPLQMVDGLHPTQAITKSIDTSSPEQIADFVDRFIRRRL